MSILRRRPGVCGVVFPTLLLAAACSSPATRTLAVVDTLPSGIERVTSTVPTGWTDSTAGWALEEQFRITGEMGTPSELIGPQSLAVDEAGRIYLMDRKPAVIKLFGADGRFLRTVGREGEGPGEFRTGFVATFGMLLVVHDPQTARTSVFDSSGSYLRSWASACCHWREIQVDTAGLVYLPAMPTDGIPGYPLIRYRIDGTVADTIRVAGNSEERQWIIRQGKDNMASTPIPLTPRVTSAIHPQGGLVQGFSGDFQLARSLTGRDTVRLFRRNWDPVPVSAAARQQLVDDMVKAWDWLPAATTRAVFLPQDIPTTRPAFNRLLVDPQGQVWVRTDLGTDDGWWDVFAPSGAWLGRVQLPSRAEDPIMIGTEAITIATEDAEGLPVIIRYRIRKPA